jgi:hypothetical protein
MARRVIGCPDSGSGVRLAGSGVLPVGEQGDDGGLEMPQRSAVQQPGGALDVARDVGGADAGDGHRRGVGQVSQPVRARCGDLPGLGEQEPHVPVGLVPALPGFSQRR